MAMNSTRAPCSTPRAGNAFRIQGLRDGLWGDTGREGAQDSLCDRCLRSMNSQLARFAFDTAIAIRTSTGRQAGFDATAQSTTGLCR